MMRTLGGQKTGPALIALFPGGICKSQIKLRILLSHIDTDKPFFLRKPFVFLNGIIQQIAQTDTQLLPVDPP